MSAVPLQACRAHLFKEAGGLRNNNRMFFFSFAILRTALVCLRGTRSRRRKTNLQENDLEIEKGLAGLT